MTAVSATIEIDNTSYTKLETLASITLTKGKTYSIQVQNIAHFKVANAEFVFDNEKFPFTQGDDDVFVKVPGLQAIVTILENTGV